MKQQLNLFFLALGFFSRIPMPAWIEYSPENLNRASRYFTLVGWLLGGLVALVFIAADYLFSNSISLWLAMAFSLLLTGAFHEDGLADTADGFGGAFMREKKLSIMKDSRIGTYGATALVMALLGKYVLLIENTQIALSILIAYALSRAVAASLAFDMRYVAEQDGSKSKPLANNQSKTDLIILLTTCLPVFFLLHWQQALLIIATLIVIRYAAKYYFQKQIGGYTGDCLGAAQQTSELVIYALLVVAIL
ncbi:adenosylcobinamide-GDP ribazoletransferase [Cellvibrio sp. OA-2007]|uniref:adenosylcobinamide-GDP ribazoletransferase n=1 Tax=Cellvibrio sp. OA-2007 TaxID=529823 RepID=UPI0007838994|nr:adenosylcobinamide-GDP ribazoletransferase [Cellvibrio sp. OA-2007]